MPSPNQKQFLTNLKKSLDTTHADMVKLAQQRADFQRRVDDGIWQPEYASAEIEAVEREMQKRHDEGEEQVNDLIAKRIEELAAADALDPSMLTPDAELLKLDVLDAHDLAQMQKRNAGNPTMGRLIVKYAQRHGVEVDVPSYVYELAEDRNTAKNMYEVTRVALKWVGDEKQGQNVLDRLFAQVGV